MDFAEGGWLLENGQLYGFIALITDPIPYAGRIEAEHASFPGRDTDLLLEYSMFNMVSSET